MESSFVLPLVAVGGLIIGIIIAKFLFRKNIKRKEEESSGKAQMILREAETKAENVKKEKIQTHQKSKNRLKKRKKNGR